MKRALLAPLSALLVASLSACGGARDLPDKQLEALRAEIVKLRTETAMLADRVGALERPSSKSAGQAAPKGALSPDSSDEGSDRPPLEVVRLEPGAQRSPESGAKQVQGEPSLLGDAALHDEADEDEDEPRPMLRSVAGGGVVSDEGSARTSRATKPALGYPRAAKAEVPR